MELSILIMKQLLVMFSLSGIGFLLAKLKLISYEGCKELVNLLLYAVIPLTVLNSFLVEKTPEKTQLLLYSLLLSLAVFAVSMLLSYIIYGKRKRVENFSAAFSNAGFIGIPLVQATVGPHAVFYIAGFVTFLNIFQWIYGAYVKGAERRMISFQVIAKNAVLLSFITGFTLYLCDLGNILFIKDIANTVANMNSPLAMIIIGVYMSQISFMRMLQRESSYICSLCRLFVIPLASLGLLAVIPLDCCEVKVAICIVLSAPVGANVAMFAQKFHQDYTYAVEIVILSTLMSVVTLPMIVYAAQIVL